jgi:hypothetical protein
MPIKSSYRKCAGVMLHRLTRRFRADALVDRELRFIASLRRLLAAWIAPGWPTTRELKENNPVRVPGLRFSVRICIAVS